ncbi:MAG TPA: aminoglycoside phosphotransferase family protein [Verrucomicrobiae bacterium]|nr:aminoglycoside phosphotransferase family protein [Verrucomicrobiae bacterium]
MATSDDLSKDTIALVQKLYGVSLTGAWPILQGDYSQVFQASDDKGATYVVKIHPEFSEPSALVIKYLQSINFKWMPKQYISKDGNVWERCDEGYVSIQDFIESPTSLVWDSAVDDDCYRQMGAALHDLHELDIPEDLASKLPKETYIPRFLNEWRQVEGKIASGNDSIAVKLQKITAEHAAKIAEIIDRSIALGKELEPEGRKLGLVHGDFHLGNVIKPESGQIYVVDWDFPSISLPENDMAIFINPARAAKVAAGYDEPGFPEPRAHVYYSLGKILRGLAAFGGRAVNTNLTDTKREQSVTTFHGMLLDNSDADNSLNFARSLDS